MAVSAAPVGSRFQVNTITEGCQGCFHGAAVASDGAGDFVVVWNTHYRAGAITGQRFDRTGAPVGAEFQVSNPNYYGATSPAVASDAAGHFVVVWEDNSYAAVQLGDDGYGGILARRYDNTGAPLGSTFLVNTHTTGFESNPKIAADADGDFVVVWHTYDAYTNNFIMGRRFSKGGVALGGEFQVNTYTGSPIGYQGIDEDPDGIEVAAAPRGEFMVVWSQYDLDGDRDGIFARAFSSTGSPGGPQFQVNTYTQGRQNYPGIAADGDGNFVVVWNGKGPVSEYTSVSARRYDSSGTPLGADFRVNTTDPDVYSAAPKVAADRSGNFEVVWSNAAGYLKKILGRTFDRAATPLGGEFEVGASDGYLYLPDAAANAAGDFVVVWADGSLSTSDGDPWGIFGQRFAAGTGACTLAPRMDCREPTLARRGLLSLRDDANDARDALVWQWTSGEATAIGDFGDPFGTTPYALCLYDASAAAQPLTTARAPAGGLCLRGPCWHAIGTLRIDYSDLTLAPDGLSLLRLVAGTEGKARILVKAKGSNLGLPALPLTAPVTVQLQAAGGACWTASYSTFISRNGDGQFRAQPGS